MFVGTSETLAPERGYDHDGYGYQVNYYDFSVDAGTDVDGNTTPALNVMWVKGKIPGMRNRGPADQQNNAGLYFTGTAPFSLYNGALRMYYQYSAASLKGLYTGADGVIDYAGGSDARYRLKSNVRRLTLEPQRGILNQLDPLKTTTKATPRFWKTNVGWNVAGKLSAAGGLFGLGVAGYRIANAENKLSETGKVATGFAGAWIGMQAVGPLAATAGAFSGPAAPFVTGGILLIGGAAGALGAEWMFDQF